VILLDTNVISALMRRAFDPAVETWLNRQHRSEIWTSSITVMEVETGIARLPDGRKKDGLAESWAEVLAVGLEQRVAAFDEAAARAAAHLSAARARAGITVKIRDTQIAGITLSRQAILATRNIRDFQDLGDSVIDPFETNP
jgi:predicted nucleic acid-binding protein